MTDTSVHAAKRALGHRCQPPFCGRIACATLLLAAQALAQPQVLTFFSSVDDSGQPYALYLPKDFNPAKRYPLMMSLHGAYSNHRLNLRRVFGRGNVPGETDAEATRLFPPLKEVEFIVASPLARGTMGYRLIAEKDVYDVLADVERRFPIDPDRVYLTGLSMGGGGTLWLGLTRPDVWAAIAAVCPDPPPGTEALAGNALDLPVHLFHGELDDTVPVAVSRQWLKRLLDLGTRAEYIEYPGVHHNAWDSAYKDGAIFEWFGKFKRNRFPERVRFTSDAYKYSSAYWVRLDGLTPGTPASIDARLTGPNRVEVKTTALDGFTLRLAGHPGFVAGRPLEVTIDGAVHRVARPRDSVSFRKNHFAWSDDKKRSSDPPGAKRPGLEGPIGAAVSARHIYVYGTAQADSQEIERRRQVARRAADWAAPQLKLQLDLPVLADKDVTEADATGSNLVLFGSKETNRLIARFAGKLPLELNPGAADYGLMYVAPEGNRYLAINSGLPFFTGAADAGRFARWYIGVVPTTLDSFGDYILFRGSLANVVAEGRFDRDWKLPPGEAEKLKGTGAVQTR